MYCTNMAVRLFHSEGRPTQMITMIFFFPSSYKFESDSRTSDSEFKRAQTIRENTIGLLDVMSQRTDNINLSYLYTTTATQKHRNTE